MRQECARQGHQTNQKIRQRFSWKYGLISIIAILGIMLTGCFGRRRMSPEQRAKILDELVRNAHSICTATLVDRSTFDANTEEYHYTVKEQHYGADLPDDIHVIDGANDRLIDGEDYYLILKRSDNALYPFPLYDSKNDVLITQLTPEHLSFFRDEPVSPDEFSVPEHIKTQIEASQVQLDPTPGGVVPVSYAEDVGTVLEEADRIWEAKILEEKPLNPYVSEYKPTTRRLEGSGNFPTQMLLPKV